LLPSRIAIATDAEKISVEASAGKVILRGNVKTWAEREEEERAAWAAPGVSNVQHDIRIDIAVGASKARVRIDRPVRSSPAQLASSFMTASMPPRGRRFGTRIQGA
jgi:hypothetical protein